MKCQQKLVSQDTMIRIEKFKYVRCAKRNIVMILRRYLLMKLSKAGAIFHSGRANCASGRNLSLTLTFLLLRLCVKRKQSFVLLFLEKILFSHESTSS